MTTREYILAANPIIRPVSGQMVREVKERTDGGPWQVILVVAQDDAMDVWTALRRAYSDGREDRSAEVVDPRNLREHLEREAATEQELGDGCTSDPAATGDAALHWGRAEAYRRVVGHLEHELEQR
jgi:hypothetical protein